ncbi:MAG: PocR ligand-binding domain-containing protein [Candidatus Omnitrophica bacterium]|nr:PocR ligand-binding domain-containing protein [Candidatus Omnitrophota bacterium]
MIIRPQTNSINSPEISFRELIDLKEWQVIQDNFAIITGIGLRTLDAQGNPICKPSGVSKLCSDLFKDVRTKNAVCRGCLPAFLGGEAVVDKNLGFSCYMLKTGISNFVVPLRLKDARILAYIIVGPLILIKRHLKSEYACIAEELNLDLEELWNAVLQLRVISYQGVQSLVDLLKEIGEYTVNLANQASRMKKEKAMAMAQNFAKMGRLFDTVLEVAFEITKANVGSVMLFDNRKKELAIHVSRGLPVEVVRDTRVKLGERISGIVAQEGRSFLVDDSIDDSRIRSYLNRPQLGSAMVLPLKIENEILGVINLGAYCDSGTKFTKDNLKLIQKLLNLISLAIHQ